jgi:GntR family transcriptional regulator
MYRVFENDLGIEVRNAQQTISATSADRLTGELLSVPEGSPLLSMERLTISSDERPLELLRSVYLPEYFRFSINLTRRF